MYLRGTYGGYSSLTIPLVFRTCSHPTPSHCQFCNVVLAWYHCDFLAASFLVVSLCNSGSFERDSGRNTWKQKDFLVHLVYSKEETFPQDTDPGEGRSEHLGKLSHHTVARRGSSVAVPWQSLLGMQGRAGNLLHPCGAALSTELVSSFFLLPEHKCVCECCAAVCLR